MHKTTADYHADTLHNVLLPHALFNRLLTHSALLLCTRLQLIMDVDCTGTAECASAAK